MTTRDAGADAAPGKALDLDGIEAAARAATPGPWQVSGCREKLGGKNYEKAQAHAVGPDGDCVALVLYEERRHRQHWMDAKFIATADPPTVLALIARAREADRLEERVRGLERRAYIREQALEQYRSNERRNCAEIGVLTGRLLAQTKSCADVP